MDIKDLLTRLEGFSYTTYRDVAGLPTIGIGHLLTKDELASGKIYLKNEVLDCRDALTTAQIDRLLDHDLEPTINAIHKAVTVPLGPGQSAALASLVFNIGVNAFQNSTLLKKLNASDYASIPDEMRRWNRAGGQIIGGLMKRREIEIECWLEG